MDQNIKDYGSPDSALDAPLPGPRDRAEEYFRLLIECSTDVMLVLGRGAEVLFAGGGGLKELGYEPGDLVGKIAQDFIHPDDLAEQSRVASQALAESGLVTRSEARVRHRSGSWIACEVMSRASRDPEGRSVLMTTLRNITERLETANQLRESAATLRKIIDGSPDIISINRFSDGSYVDTSRSFRGSGFDRTEVVGKSSGKIGIWADRKQYKEYLRLLNKRGTVRNLEVDFKLKDGGISPCLISATTAELNGEKCVISFSRDITELKRARNRLAESERRFRTVFGAMPGAAGIMSPTGKFLELSKPLAGSGLTREECIGKTVDEIGFWADPSEREEFNRRMRRDGFVDGMEVRMGCKEGGSIPCLVSVAPLEIDGERCAVAIILDITELKNAQHRAAESQAALGRIFESSTDSMILSDFSSGEVIEVNREFTRLTGHSRKEAIGRDVRALNLWSDRAKAAEFVELLRSTNEARNIEDLVRNKAGHQVPCLMSGTVVEFAGRKCCLAVSRDITMLKRTQDQLVVAREAALTASQAKSEFLSSMSHEIRTPMNAILGMAELLDETELDRDQKKYVETMRNNGNALLGLINDILDLAKVESGRLTLENTDFDLEDLVGSVAEMLAVRAHSKGLEILAHVKPEVPLRVCGDSLRLRQILINLLGNSIKFTESGQVLVTVDLDETSEGKRALHFSVSDTGIGIARDKLDAIFSNFTQADSSTSRRYGGSGLGLAIAKRLVELMGGHIWVESEMGHGSVFHFTAQFETATTEACDEKIVTPAKLGDARVLIVDDNSTNRLILNEMMTKAGAQVVEAEGGAQALHLIEEARRNGNQFGLMLLDCRMPQIDGLEVAHRLRDSSHHDLTIVMLTSDDLRLNVSTFDENGLDGYLTKPVRRVELFEAIANAEARREGRAPAASASRARVVSDAAKLDGLKLRILLADDSADNRLLVRSFFKNFPFHFDDAENGRVAVDKWKPGKYDLVIMDVQMPEMDGLTAIQMIRGYEEKGGTSRTPIVALSAAALEEDVKRSLKAGADLHVNKPVKKKTLIDAIVKAVEDGKILHQVSTAVS
jgi:two-component system, sensor histidine kinase and response regulator